MRRVIGIILTFDGFDIEALVMTLFLTVQQVRFATVT